MKKAMLLAAAALGIAAAPAAGQTISQGMTVAQVQSEFGAPATTRDAGEWTYWYYHNGCPVRCGSDDVVFFQNGRVVTAVLRTGRRRYAGPSADQSLQATDDGTSAVRASDPSAAGTVIVGGVRVEGGTPPPAGVIIVPAPTPTPDEAVEGTPVPAREGRPGEPSMTVIQRSEANIVAPAAAPRSAAEGQPAPAENTEATDTRGQTSIDRKNERNERRSEPTATERARRNDRRGNP